MKRLEFNPDDFIQREKAADITDIYDSAKRAQQVFDQWYAENIESAPVVYGFLGKCSNWNAEWYVSESKDNYEARARIVCIEPNPKKECSHDKIETYGGAYITFKCASCGEVVKPKGGWEVV